MPIASIEPANDTAMIFTSPEFVIFFCVVIPAFFMLGVRWRWVLLLIASYVFYAYGNVQYLPLIIASTLVDYVAARRIGALSASDDHEPQRRLWLVVSVVTNLGILFTFKYFNFFSDSLSQITGYEALRLDWLLPIGISFYTFQSMAYTIDVYRRKLQPEKHLGIMATYVAFFPQLVAGPIERAPNLLPQFRKKHTFDVDRTVEGLQRILWGVFKKVVIADRLAIYVNAVYNDVGQYQGAPLIIATVFFAFQIYCDFSAYSDIAIGTARIMGFNLMENFRQPYFATSIREFWGRWHISLSTWFRDYVYIPLGGNRVPLMRNLFNLMIVFLLSGLWHGAGWTFVIWGALHGLGVVVVAYTRAQGWSFFAPDSAWWRRMLAWALTFAFVTLCWVFFRANSLDDALYILANALPLGGQDIVQPFSMALLPAQTELMLSCWLIGFLLLVDYGLQQQSLARFVARWPVVVRWVGYYGLGAAVIWSGLYGTGAQQFIYFQF